MIIQSRQAGIRRILQGLFAALAWIICTPLAQAGPARDEPRQLALPWTLAAEQEGAESVWAHAAGLGFLDGSQVVVGFSAPAIGDEGQAGALGALATRIGPVGLGFGYSWFNEGAFDEATHRFDISLAWRVHSTLAIGLEWVGLFNNLLQSAGDLDGYDSWSVGATWRPLRQLALAVGVDRFTRPHLGDDFLNPVAHMSLAFRPNSERVSFGLESRVLLDEPTDWSLGGTLRMMPVTGFVVGGYGRYQRRLDGPDMLQWGAFLGFEQGHLGLESTLDRVDSATGQGAPSMSVGMLARASSRMGRSLYRAPKRVVKIALRGRIPERHPVELFAQPATPFGSWLQYLEAIGADDSVDAVLLDVVAAPPWGQAWELRQALNGLRARGKRIYARFAWSDMRGMYLASVADRIFIDPSGGVMLLGLSITRTYFANLLSKLGVRAQFVKWEGYKSAPEALTRTGPSEPASEQTRDLLTSFNRSWLDAVGRGRGLSLQELQEVFKQGPHTMKSAHEKRLVDQVVFDDELAEAIGEDIGHEVEILTSYRPPARGWSSWGTARGIAVVPVVGTIMDGKGQPLILPYVGQSTGEREFNKHLEHAVKDPNIVGIVVRVDSPGGSVVASDRMYRAIEKAREVKPVVVSFGNVAASGGYYLACGARHLLATPVSITGSIGIFTGKLDLSGLYDAIGVSTSTAKTAEHADANGFHRPWSPDEEEGARKRLGVYYDRFVGLVAKARGLDTKAARERAQGKVYTGERALELGLIDGYGGLMDAVAAVRLEAGVGPEERIDLRYPRAPGLLDRVRQSVMNAFGVEAPGPSHVLEEDMGRLLGLARSLNGQQVQARLPYDLKVN